MTDPAYPQQQPPAAPAAPAEPSGLQIVRPLYNAKGWLKLLGVLAIIGGIFYCITIVGIIIAWLPIWMGVLAVQSSNRYAQAIDRNDPNAAMEACRKLQTIITIQGVLALIGLILGGIGMLVSLGTIFARIGLN